MSNDRHRHNAAYRSRDSKRTRTAKSRTIQRRQARRTKYKAQGR
jgi:hypothetical protein